MSNRIHEQAKAYMDLAAWLQEAPRLRDVFMSIGVPVPPQIQRILSSDERDPAGGKKRTPSINLSAPWGDRPGEIGVRLQDLGVRSLVLTFIKNATQSHGEGATVRDAIEWIKEIRPSQNEGSVMNAFAAVCDLPGVKTFAGRTTVTNLAMAPSLGTSYAFGPPGIFQKQEVAAHRREAIELLLGLDSNRGGLHIMQIVNQLKTLDWVKADATKDLLKGDMAAMLTDGIVKRAAGSGKWKLSRESE